MDFNKNMHLPVVLFVMTIVTVYIMDYGESNLISYDEVVGWSRDVSVDDVENKIHETLKELSGGATFAENKKLIQKIYERYYQIVEYKVSEKEINAAIECAALSLLEKGNAQKEEKCKIYNLVIKNERAIFERGNRKLASVIHRPADIKFDEAVRSSLARTLCGKIFKGIKDIFKYVITLGNREDYVGVMADLLEYANIFFILTIFILVVIAATTQNLMFTSIIVLVLGTAMYDGVVMGDAVIIVHLFTFVVMRMLQIP